MRILADNCLPLRFAELVDEHEVETTRSLNWNALKDGEMLDRMAGAFDVLLTVDRSLRFQQRLHDRPFAVIVLLAKTDRIADLRDLLPSLTARLNAGVEPGNVYEISAA